MFSGKIKKCLYNHRDDLDGWELQEGTLIHFPPHIGETLSEWIGDGDEVFLEGESYTNRNGRETFFPTYIESQGWSLTFDQKIPRHRKDSDWNRKVEERSHVSNEEIMQELLKIRKLLEAWIE